MAHSDLVMLARSWSALLFLSLAVATSTLTEPADPCELGGDAETDPTPICSLKDWTEPEFGAGLNHDDDNANVLELDPNVTQPQSGTDQVPTQGELEATASDLYAMKDLTEEPPFIAEPLNMEEFLADVRSQEPMAPMSDSITPVLLPNTVPPHTTTIFLVDDETVAVTPSNVQIQKPGLNRLQTNTKRHQRSVSFAHPYQSTSSHISDVDLYIDYAGFRFKDRCGPIPAAMTSPRYPLMISALRKKSSTPQLAKLEEKVDGLSKRCDDMESLLKQVKDEAAQSPRTAVSTPLRDLARIQPRASSVTPQRRKQEPNLGKVASPRPPALRRSRSAQSVAPVAMASPNNARAGMKADRSPQVAEPPVTPVRARTRMGPDGGSPRPMNPKLKSVPARSASAKRSSIVATRK